jgi:hypothetical protein
MNLYYFELHEIVDFSCLFLTTKKKNGDLTMLRCTEVYSQLSCPKARENLFRFLILINLLLVK